MELSISKEQENSIMMDICKEHEITKELLETNDIKFIREQSDQEKEQPDTKRSNPSSTFTIKHWENSGVQDPAS